MVVVFKDKIGIEVDVILVLEFDFGKCVMVVFVVGDLLDVIYYIL